jgi:diketogulonate reductase-like aldo/keto reductase
MRLQVEHAIRHGYRHLDLAFIYKNQDEVAKALSRVVVEKGGPNPVVKRDELFITSKVRTFPNIRSPLTEVTAMVQRIPTR